MNLLKSAICANSFILMLILLYKAFNYFEGAIIFDPILLIGAAVSCWVFVNLKPLKTFSILTNDIEKTWTKK